MRMFELMNECDRIDIELVKNWLDKLKCKALIVRHDKDEGRKAHFHCYVSMVGDRDIDDVAKQLNTEKQYIQFIKSWKNALAYAFHLTEKSQEDGKYQYTEEAVVFKKGVNIEDIFDTATKYESDKAHREQLLGYLYQYGNCEITKAKMLSYMTAEDYNTFAKTFKKMQEYRIMKVRHRDMQVIYITGPSGSGKTTLAKYFAIASCYDYFVSGSGKDVLDGYDKEECIILDDLRADAFTKAELFKLTDNNTNSSVKSRFHNKDISYCKLMIITSIKAPQDLYNWDTASFEDKDETFAQFARRIGNTYLYVADNTSRSIYRMQYDKSNYSLSIIKTKEPFNMYQVFDAMNISIALGKDLFSQVLDKVANKLKDKEIKDEEDLPF